MNYSLISKYRNQLFGLSILNIIIFHYAEDVLAFDGALPGFVVTLCSFYMKVLASVGVEIFLFLSGMGLYYSMQKKPALKEFYTKRLTRLLIPYTVVGGIFWIVNDMIISDGNVLDWLYDFTFLSFWSEGNRAIWYIGLLALLYLFFPFIFRFCEHEESRTVRIVGLTAGSMAATVILALLVPEFVSNTEVALGRVAVFLAGYALSPAIKKCKKDRIG